MTSDRSSGSGWSQSEPEWRRRRRLDSVFGDDLPEQIAEAGEKPRSSGRDWYEANRPPHHG